MRTPSSLWENLLSSSYQSCTRCKYAASRYQSSELVSILWNHSLFSAVRVEWTCVRAYWMILCQCIATQLTDVLNRVQRTKLLNAVALNVWQYCNGSLCWFWRSSVAEWIELLDAEDVHVGWSSSTALFLFNCSSLNGATQIQEFPDLKGTSSLEILWV